MCTHVYVVLVCMVQKVAGGGVTVDHNDGDAYMGRLPYHWNILCGGADRRHSGNVYICV